MAVDAAAVAAYLATPEAALADPAGAVAAVKVHAAELYDEPTADEQAEGYNADRRATWERALVMAAAALCRRRNTTGTTEGAGGRAGNRPVVTVSTAFDGEPAQLLAPFLKVRVFGGGVDE